MLRNLAAIIIATIAGLAAAKFFEGALGGGAGPDDAAASGRFLFALVLGWGVGAFVAASIALIGARRWAPLGWLGAATIFFAAVITMTSFALPLATWPLSAAACAGGGFAAIRLWKAQMQPPRPPTKETLFD